MTRQNLAVFLSGWLMYELGYRHGRKSRAATYVRGFIQGFAEGTRTLDEATGERTA